MPVSVAITRLLEQLKDVKVVGESRWMSLCPAHDDKRRSLSITVGLDGRVLLKCHALCATTAIVAAIGLTMSDLFSEPLVQPSAVVPGVSTRPKLVKSYDYYTADGTLLFQVCRMDPKSFPQRRRNGNGEWTWNLDGITPVLYRLPEIIEAVAEERRVYIVEGEKDADALAELGYPATTSPMGAGKWRESYAEPLTGADVVIFPDNDDPGRSHAEQIAASLTARNARVRVVALPNLPPKGDFSDWIATGDLDALESLIGRTPLWSADPIQARHKTRWRLDELWENDDIMRPPPPVVPYLAWASRSTLLAAREKSGKSTLTGFIAAAVSRGGDFLGEPCEHGNVLILGLEEYLGDTARRLRQFGADGTKITLVDRFAGPATDRPSEVRAHIEAVAPVLVIVDSLIAYSRGVVADANNATQTQGIVQGLADLSHQTAAALIIIHHARKADGKYRDSSAIGGAVDVIAEVFPPEETEKTDPTRRRVRPIGRVPARSVDFRFTGDGYELVDISGPQKGPLDQRITTVVRERPGLSASEVCDAVGERKAEVLTRITHMISSGLLINDGNSRWQKLRVPTFAPARSLM